MRNWRKWVLVGVALWIAGVTFWALQPISAVVYTGVNADGTARTATVECDSPLSGNTSPTQALPILGSGESFGSVPCDGPVKSGRALYVLDMLVAVAVVVAVIVIGRRSDERTPAEPTVSQGAPASV